MQVEVTPNQKLDHAASYHAETPLGGEATEQQAFIRSPLLRALKQHFDRYEGLTEPRVGPQRDDL